MTKKNETAAELLARLNSDPNHVKRRMREEEAHQELAEELRLLQQPLVKELGAAGYTIDSVWDLVNRSEPYPRAIPILWSHLRQHHYPPRVREGIARALAVPEARVHWNDLVTLYQQESDASVRDGLATAVAGAADIEKQDVLSKLITLLRNRVYGPSRLLLLHAVARSDRAEAKEALTELAVDPELGEEVRSLLPRQ